MFQLRGNEFNPLGRSIDVHIHRLRNKLESRPSKPAYIRTVRGKGYVLHLP
ncbi:helix-turn-helix domain-containing protein [Candidatus Thiothrix sp. Deng01]|uniref:Helix-turn-helix domain-containing protein n=1 Tax=Candidatus Thiothrix phosphatis TaxID=3112415 RepID=A0ABU6CWT1_9GAMM|nr:helix-turn-helix domain-containing protein [Candidatus Thiothrix sp. Deng01]